MKVSLSINGHDISEYIIESGISVKTVRKNEKSVITLDGVEHKTWDQKRQIDVELLSMPDNEFQTISGYLATNPATVVYGNLETGTTITGSYYINDFSYTAKKAVGAITVVSGGSFSLEER